ncbi:MAG TPA: Na+/H+ antiporter subunit E [Rubrivivax sp.]|nr:Na+/H+ antiporter subunit E [Rubrivivax sp.]
MRPGWLPHPVLSLLLALVWLLLQQSLAPAQLLTALALALAVPRLVHGFLGDAVRPRAPGTMLHLAGVVLWDIVASNLAVARIVLNPRADPRPAWVEVQLQAEHPTAITLLAAIITMTPGTVSCVVDERRRAILVHALDCSDAAAMAAQIKQRYERPLRRIFEGVAA